MIAQVRSTECIVNQTHSWSVFTTATGTAGARRCKKHETIFIACCVIAFLYIRVDVRIDRETERYAE